MQSTKKAASSESSAASEFGLRFLIEPEPWLHVFARNIADLFRAAPPVIWISAKPAEYWADALVHRPVAWKSVRRSFLGHALVITAVYALNLVWLNQPQVLPETAPTQSVLHYEVSEYLPAVNSKPQPPRRARPQKADPELAPQEIVVTNENHISTKQNIVQPSSFRSEAGCAAAQFDRFNSDSRRARGDEPSHASPAGQYSADCAATTTSVAKQPCIRWFFRRLRGQKLQRLRQLQPAVAQSLLCPLRGLS